MHAWLNCPECDAEALESPDNLFEDGTEVDCPECGTPLQVTVDEDPDGNVARLVERVE